VILLAVMIGQWNHRRARRWTMSGAALCLLLIDRVGRAPAGGFAALNIGLHHIDEFGVLTIALFEKLKGPSYK
jgi:hypothetical protein